MAGDFWATVFDVVNQGSTESRPHQLWRPPTRLGSLILRPQRWRLEILHRRALGGAQAREEVDAGHALNLRDGGDLAGHVGNRASPLCGVLSRMAAKSRSTP